VRHIPRNRRGRAALYPGTGAAVPPSTAAIRAGNIFPSDQVSAYDAFKAAVAEYPTTWSAPDVREAQAGADTDWLDGNDAAGHKTGTISAPTLIADGTDDQLDPVANDRILARLIPGARLVLYPDAGHGFLFQEGTSFASLVESFLTGHPSP
jgi:pimeloyl-ACP methyl ester carboxylesterase